MKCKLQYFLSLVTVFQHLILFPVFKYHSHLELPTNGGFLKSNNNLPRFLRWSHFTTSITLQGSQKSAFFSIIHNTRPCLCSLVAVRGREEAEKWELGFLAELCVHLLFLCSVPSPRPESTYIENNVSNRASVLPADSTTVTNHPKRQTTFDTW